MKKEDKSLKIIIDTNLWISFLMGKCLSGLQELIHIGKIDVVTCDEQISEIFEVLTRKKFRKYFTEKSIDEFFDLFEESTCNVGLKTITDLCRDPKDNFLVSLAIDSNANYLISGDKDLLDLKIISKTKVITYKEFEDIVLRGFDPMY